MRMDSIVGVPSMSGDASPGSGRALALLRSLASPDGIHASLTETTNYRAVFARDAVMAGIAGLLVDDILVVGGMTRTLEHLRDLQGAQGQIASNYDVSSGTAPKVSFGTLAPRIDSSTWYLVGVGMAARTGAIAPGQFHESVRGVIGLLDALEYNGRHLIYVPPGGNWADEYVLDGYILYDQVLRLWGLRLCGTVYNEPGWMAKADRIEERIAESYWPPDATAREHPIATFSPTQQRDVFDLAACSLLAVSRVLPERGSHALEWIAKTFLKVRQLPPAFSPVIDETHPDWPALHRYHLHEFRNNPHEYHNGGVWPVWLGWLAMAFGVHGRSADLAMLRALANDKFRQRSDYHFEEFLRGNTGQPGGTPSMAYSATGDVFIDAADSPPATRLFAR